MPFYDHECVSCGYEWEDFYGINTDPPTICPKCKEESAKRVISLTAPGVVQLTGRDLVNKVKSDARKIANESTNNENLKANLMGENAFNNLVK